MLLLHWYQTKICKQQLSIKNNLIVITNQIPIYFFETIELITALAIEENLIRLHLEKQSLSKSKILHDEEYFYFINHLLRNPKTGRYTK